MVNLDPGTTYELTVKRPRRNQATYVATYMGSTDDGYLLFSLPDHPGTDLRVEDGALIEAEPTKAK